MQRFDASMPGIVEEGAAPYHSLCARAVDFVQAEGGIVQEDVLIGYVFGNTGSLALWRPLLRSVLSADERLVFRA
ncbi:MAG: hypothetical protein M3121_06380, partial [Chloroflexota bacterium]|nr:hypothetical protein [Chloroflexota bacterium]